MIAATPRARAAARVLARATLTAIAATTALTLAAAPARATPFAQPKRERLTTPEDATWTVAIHGASTAIAGDRVLIGAPLTDISVAANAGLATLYLRDGDAWIASSFPGQVTNQAFAAAVALTPEWRVVSAPGSALVFLIPETGDATWAAGKTVIPIGPATSFGNALALRGTSLLVGAPGSTIDVGRVLTYRYDDPSETWSYEAVFSATTPALNDNFGAAITIDGDLAAIGAPGTAPGGAVYLLSRAGPEVPWVLAPDPLLPTLQTLDEFGAAIAIEGDLMAIGAPGSVTKQGRVALYQRDRGVWSPITVLEPPAEAVATTPMTRFGDAVAITEGSLLVGATGAGTGAVYLFNAPLDGGPPSVIITDPSGDDVMAFGRRLAIDGRRAVVGAPGTGAAGSTGYAYVLDLVTGTGVPCESGEACSSGYCVDGLCCDQACDDVCVACSLAAGGVLDGICTPVLCTGGTVCWADACIDNTGTSTSGGETTSSSDPSSGDDSATTSLPGLILEPIASAGCTCRARAEGAATAPLLILVAGLAARRRRRR